MTASPPSRTTLLGGAGLVIVALLQLVPLVANWVPTADPGFQQLLGAPGQLVRTVVLLAACVVLAFGLPGERDVVAGSRLGRTGFLVWGLAAPLVTLLSFVILGNPSLVGTPAVVVVGTALEFLPALGTLLAGVSVARAGILGGAGRWLLLAAAIAEILYLLLTMATAASQAASFAVVFVIAAVPLLLLLSAGMRIALDGRTAAIRDRVRAVDAAWRSSTP